MAPVLGSAFLFSLFRLPPFEFVPLYFCLWHLLDRPSPVYKWSQSRRSEDWALFETAVRNSDVDGDREEIDPQSLAWLEEEQGRVQ